MQSKKMKKKFFALFFGAFTTLCLCASVSAQTVRLVNTPPGFNDPAIYTSIQAAHGASANGNSIYVESTDVDGKTYSDVTFNRFDSDILNVVAYSQEPSPSKTNKLSLALKVGTTGISPEFSYRLKNKINLRASISIFTYKRNDVVSFDQGKDIEEGKVQYDAKLKLGNVGVLVDYFPFRKLLALNLGVFYNMNAVDVSLLPKSNLKFNDRTFTPEETGTLGLKINYQKIAPYAGISLGNPNNGNFRVLFDFGFLYTGSPLITMQGSGSIEPTAEQAPQLQTNLKPIYLYPVVKLGLSYRILKQK